MNLAVADLGGDAGRICRTALPSPALDEVVEGKRPALSYFQCPIAAHFVPACISTTAAAAWPAAPVAMTIFHSVRGVTARNHAFDTDDHWYITRLAASSGYRYWFQP
jgi:hypothetical protein